MKYAIIENGVVVNIAVSNRQIAANWVAIPIGCPVAIGDTYASGCFYDAGGNLRLPPEMVQMQALYEKAYQEGVQDA